MIRGEFKIVNRNCMCNHVTYDGDWYVVGTCQSLRDEGDLNTYMDGELLPDFTETPFLGLPLTSGLLRSNCI